MHWKSFKFIFSCSIFMRKIPKTLVTFLRKFWKLTIGPGFIQCRVSLLPGWTHRTPQGSDISLTPARVQRSKATATGSMKSTTEGNTFPTLTSVTNYSPTTAARWRAHHWPSQQAKLELNVKVSQDRELWSSWTGTPPGQALSCTVEPWETWGLHASPQPPTRLKDVMIYHTTTLNWE